MRRFWTAVLQPLLAALEPKTLFEIGSDHGDNTHHLLGFCQHHAAVLHAIDPYPSFDVAAWEKTYAGHFVFHRGLSLAVLPQLGAADAVMIDGDHNWYTVFHELQAIDRLSQAAGCSLPLIILHDVGWPYARRDMYYDPASIPEAYRQPYRRTGLGLGSSETLPSGGLAAHLNNSLHDGGPRNGVLTAVEDFCQASPRRLHFSQAPGFHGLGILAEAALLEQHAALAALVAKINQAFSDSAGIRALEAQRIAAEIKAAAAQRQARAGPAGRVVSARARLASARLRLAEWRLSQSIAAKLA